MGSTCTAQTVCIGDAGDAGGGLEAAATGGHGHSATVGDAEAGTATRDPTPVNRAVTSGGTPPEHLGVVDVQVPARAS